MAGGKRPVSRPADERRVKAEFGYDDSIGVGACDREPYGLGTTREGLEPVSRIAEKAG